MASRDDLHRTVKLELDEGTARSIEEAEALAATYVLQIVVGRDVAGSPTRQAMLLTAANAGARAFRGGVHVTGHLDWTFVGAWQAGLGVRDAVASFGASVVDSLNDGSPTIVIGHVDERVPGTVSILATWNGWVGGVVTAPEKRLGEATENPVAGVAAAGLAVSEAFQHVRGSVTAGRRDFGISLWDPGAKWDDSEAVGPELEYLPTRLWILGIGHLGQAYLWLLGFLPYRDRTAVEFTLQDFDRVVEANRATGLLVLEGTPAGTLKTRVGAEALEALGFRTRLIERPFDQSVLPGPGEPTWALAGFDSSDPRRYLGTFEFAVDMGLGAGHDDYLGIRLHTFPAAGDPAVMFDRSNVVTGAAGAEREPAAWAAAASTDPCGILQLEDVAVGASFVGAVAAALAFAEVLSALAGNKTTAVLSWGLGAPEHVDVADSSVEGPINPGFQVAAWHR